MVIWSPTYVISDARGVHFGKKYGKTCIFRSDGVYVETPLPSGATLVTKIGINTPQRLYSFDLDALERHSERVKLEYAGSPVFDMSPMIEGVREISITG